MLISIAALFASLAAFSAPSPQAKVSPRPAKRLILHPVARESAKQADLTSFAVKHANGKLWLYFTARDKTWEFDAHQPFVIQLDPQGSWNISPATITRLNWPKKGGLLALSYGGVKHQARTVLKGEASYLACKRGTRMCKRMQSKIDFTFIP